MSGTAEATLTEAEVRHVAKLARLRLTDDELPRLTAELSAIVGYVKKLDELDTRDVPPTTQVEVDRLPLRADVPHESFAHDVALRESPRKTDAGFAVPGFVEE